MLQGQEELNEISIDEKKEKENEKEKKKMNIVEFTNLFGLKYYEDTDTHTLYTDAQGKRKMYCDIHKHTQLHTEELDDVSIAGCVIDR
jgi:hypothetical protein